MSDLARSRWKLFSFTAVGAVMAGAVIFGAGTASSAQDTQDRGPGALAWAAAHPPEPPEPPDAPPPPHSRRPWLGITMEDERAEIEHVVEGSPAEEAGLRRGDRILEVNGHKVGDSGDVVQEIRSMDPGDSIKLRVDRDGKQMTLTATLEGRRAPAHGRRLELLGPDDFEWRGNGPGVFMVGPPGRYLGVEVHNMSDDLRAFFKAPRGTGILVNKVLKDTPAEKAGIQAGDVIVSVDGEEISRAGDIARALRDHDEGDKVPVKVLRDGSERTLEVEIADRPEMSHRSFYFNDGDGDDDENDLMVLPPQTREEIHKAIEESLRGLQNSLKSLNSEQEKIREEIRNQIRLRPRDTQRVRYDRSSYDI